VIECQCPAWLRLLPGYGFSKGEGYCKGSTFVQVAVAVNGAPQFFHRPPGHIEAQSIDLGMDAAPINMSKILGWMCSGMPRQEYCRQTGVPGFPSGLMRLKPIVWRVRCRAPLPLPKCGAAVCLLFFFYRIVPYDQRPYRKSPEGQGLLR
jgi:hypothetical protein